MVSISRELKQHKNIFELFSEVKMVDVKKYNVFMLGAAFCLVLTGFITMGGIQTLIFNSKEDFDGNGYTR
jgi:hypothetical protein